MTSKLSSAISVVDGSTVMEPLNALLRSSPSRRRPMGRAPVMELVVRPDKLVWAEN